MKTRNFVLPLVALSVVLAPRTGDSQRASDTGDSRQRRLPDAELPPGPAPYRPIDLEALKSPVFTFVRVKYSDVAGPLNQAWRVDYPDAERNFTREVARLTDLEVAPEPIVSTLTDPELQQYPFIYLVEGGRLRLSDEEAASLRSYLLGGGFLMVDDFWGREEWALLAAQLARAFPDLQPVELWPEHEVFWSFYALGERPNVPGIAAIFAASAGRKAADDPVFRGLVDRDGRLMAIFLHNMDFGDAWEHFDAPFYPKEAAWEGAIPMGINIVVYALSR